MAKLKAVVAAVAFGLAASAGQGAGLPSFPRGWSNVTVESWLDAPLVGLDERSGVPAEQYCDMLKSRNPQVPFKCAIVGFADRFVFVLDKKIEGEETYLHDQVQDEKQCRSGLNAQFKPVHEEFVRSFGREPSLRQALQAMADNHSSELPKLLLAKDCGQDRRAAAALLQYDRACNSDVESFVPLLLDPDYVVRNGVAQCVSKVASRQPDETVAKILASAFRQLRLPNHSDRNKSLGIIASIVSGRESARALVTQDDIDLLQKVAKKSSMSNVGGLAAKILDMLASTRREPS